MTLVWNDIYLLAGCTHLSANCMGQANLFLCTFSQECDATLAFGSAANVLWVGDGCVRWGTDRQKKRVIEDDCPAACADI